MYIEYDFLNEQVVKFEAKKSRTFLRFDLSYVSNLFFSCRMEFA